MSLRRSTIIFAVLAAVGPTFGEFETGGIIKAVLSNGLTILVRPEPESPVTAISIFIGIDVADETEENAGIGHLLAKCILAGTKTRSPVKLARLFSEVGGNFYTGWYWNYIEIYAVTPTENSAETLELLADTILNSKLDTWAVEYSRQEILREIQYKKDDAFEQAYDAVRRLTLKGSAYDRPYLGNPKAIETLTRTDIERFYENHLSADRTVVCVVGNVKAEDIIKKAEICFAHMKRKPLERKELWSSLSGGESKIEGTSGTAYIMVGYPAPGVEHTDYPAMLVANVILGGNKSSLLFQKLREGRGLGYQVGSLYPALRGRSHVVAYIGMDTAKATPEMVVSVQKAIEKQVESLQTGNFSNEDLERAKRYLIGKHALEHERTRDRAFRLGWCEIIGLGYRYDFLYSNVIRGVTRGDVERVCQQYLKNPSVAVLTGK